MIFLGNILGPSLIDFIPTVTEDDGRDGDNAGGGAGELLVDPVPEASGQQTQGARGGRGQHGPQGNADADLGDQNISDSTFSFDASSLH